MILILGGTTEGRAAVHLIDEAAKPYFYSTKGASQNIECLHGTRLTGGMDTARMETFCRTHDIRLLVDAAHPFASLLHETVAEVSARLHIPVVRYERRYPPRESDLIWCDDYADAIHKLEEAGVRQLLALSGVNTIRPMRPYWEKHPSCRFRILRRDESVSIAEKQGFPASRLLFFDEEEEDLLFQKLRPDAILTKESGETGLFLEKVEAARRAGIAVYVVKRPRLPETFHVVYGEEGLRKQIERLLPDFFPLRSGYTTGACATAAAKAALLAGLTGREQTESTITLPSGEAVTLPVETTEWRETSVVCSVRKDAGDDPDVTNGCRIVAEVEWTACPQKGDLTVCLRGGEGVGTVTLPGLGLEVGGPAINATPRRMIGDELRDVWQRSPLRDQTLRVTVTLSVPGGAALAARTFNPKLGIVGGISIIGTSGIVRPFSSEAFVASIRKEAGVAKAIGCRLLVINSGAKSERYLKGYIERTYGASLPPQAFVHYGNFIGETLKIAAELDFPRVVLGIMLGKAVKLAEGALDTHSKRVVMNKAFLRRMAASAGCSADALAAIDHLSLARELWKLSADDRNRLLSLLLEECRRHCAPLFPLERLSLILIDEEGGVFTTPTNDKAGRNSSGDSGDDSPSATP